MTRVPKPVWGDLSSPLDIQHKAQRHTPAWMSSLLLLVSGITPISCATVAQPSMVWPPTLLSPIYYRLHEIVGEEEQEF